MSHLIKNPPIIIYQNHCLPLAQNKYIFDSIALLNMQLFSLSHLLALLPVANILRQLSQKCRVHSVNANVYAKSDGPFTACQSENFSDSFSGTSSSYCVASHMAYASFLEGSNGSGSKCSWLTALSAAAMATHCANELLTKIIIESRLPKWV